MKIYTKTGDKGETSIYGGSRLSKDDIRIEAYGTVDELNSAVGLVRSNKLDHKTDKLLHSIQENLFVIGSLLASTEDKHDSLPKISDSLVKELEQSIDEMQEVLEPLTSFILPVGNLAVSHIHMARTICRRAERRVVSFSREDVDLNEIIVTLNRLSDYFFVLARFQAKASGINDIPWNPSA